MKQFLFSFLWIYILILIWSYNSFGQEQTLQEVLSTVIKLNPKLKSLDMIIKARQGLVRQADVRLNPGVGLGAGNRTQIVTFDQELEFPGKRRARTNAALEEVEVAKEELDAAILDIEQEITKLFYAVLCAQKNSELLRENVKVTGQFGEAASYRFTQGFGSKLDVIKGQVEVARARRLLQSAERELLTSQNKLKLFLNISASYSFTIQGDLSRANFQCDHNLDSLVYRALQIHPSLLITQHKLKASEYRVEVAQLSSKPNFNVGFTGGFEERGEPAAELSISIPLSLWDKKEGAKSEALFQQQSIEQDVENVQLNIRQQVTSAFQSYQSAEQIVTLFADTLLREARLSAEMAQKAFESGGFRFLDLIDAQRTYIDASSEYYNSLLSLRYAEIDLKTSIGILSSGGPQ